MDEKELRRIIRKARLLQIREAAERTEHRRLRIALDAWARSLGFSRVLHTLDKKEPDVLRAVASALFVGEAKDANNETASNVESLGRLANYVRSFAERVTNGRIDGGFVAVATNGSDAARGWARAIDALARDNEIERSDKGKAKVTKLRGEETWIAWW